MAPTESEIRTLLASQSYSASSLPQLEAYLAAQTSGDAEYMFDAVRTLVKLYQFFPEKKNEKNVGHCCMLALLNYPATDLLALSYLIPLATFKLEPFATIQKCSEELDSCEFIEFWKTFALLQKSDDAAIKGMAAKHEGKLQSSILSTLALSYKEAPASVVVSALNITKIDAITALKNPTVESIGSDSKTVVFVASQDNTKRKRVYQEGVNFTAISSLMAKMGQ